MQPTALINRQGQSVPFDRNRIARAINRAQQAAGADDPLLADELANVVVEHLERIGEVPQPDIERVQDAVLYVLRESGNYDVALAYARYRDARERSRRERAVLEPRAEARPNLQVIGRDGRSRAWSRDLLERTLREHYAVSSKLATDVRVDIERVLAESDITELDSNLLLSLIESSLMHHGLHSEVQRRGSLRLDRGVLADLLENGSDGNTVMSRCGGIALENYTMLNLMPDEVRRLYMSGRLWVDGMGDPLRGSHFTAALDGQPNPWHIVTQAFAQVTSLKRDWQRVSLILPPIILGTLEQGALAKEHDEQQADAPADRDHERNRRQHQDLIESLEHLALEASVYLYCDGRTPLLDKWPFHSKRISLATYAQDFLILRQLQELELEHLSGPTLMKGGYRRRVAVALAINAQGLDEQYSQLDHLAMGLVAAARMRLNQLNRPALVGADVRYAIYGLPPGSSSCEYLERQVTQEGLRCGFALSRTSSLPAEACEHLSRLFGAHAP